MQPLALLHQRLQQPPRQQLQQLRPEPPVLALLHEAGTGPRTMRSFGMQEAPGARHVRSAGRPRPPLRGIAQGALRGKRNEFHFTSMLIPFRLHFVCFPNGIHVAFS